MDRSYVKLRVNGKEYEFSIGNKFSEIPANETLLTTLRDRLELTGAKQSCDEGACGCCTVIMDGDAVPTCMLLTCECDGKDILTIEGLSNPITGALDPIQQAFIDFYAFQCGFCTPGIIMVAKALLNKNPNATRKEIEEALSGNYCRCISQYHVLEAVESVAKKVREA